MDLLLITLVLGLISAGLARVLTNLNFTTCFWYWLGWLLGISAAEFSAWAGILPSITPLGHDLIIQAHIGAFIGFVIVSFFVAGTWINGHAVETYQKSPIKISNRVVQFAIIVQLGLGVALVINRTSQVGVSGVSLLTVRDSFLNDQYGLQQIVSQLSMIFNFLPIKFGLEDGHSGSIKMRRLLLLWLIAVPAGLSSGGRGWVLGPFPIYVFSYLLAKDGPGSLAFFAKLFSKWIPLIGVMVILFSVFQILRSDDPVGALEREANLPWYQSSLSIMPAISYLGVPTIAAGPFSAFAQTWSPSYGGLIFPWVSAQLERVGLVKFNPYARFVAESRYYVLMNVDQRIWSTHATILPNLVGDFGTDGVLPAMAVLMATFQLLSIYFRSTKILGHTIVVTAAAYGGFWLFQDSMFGVAGIILPVIWAGIFQWWYYSRPTSGV